MQRANLSFLREAGEIAFLAGSGVSVDAPTCYPSGFAFTRAVLERISPDPQTAERLLQLTATASVTEEPFLRFEALLDKLADHCDEDLTILDYFDRPAPPNWNHHFLARAMQRGMPVLTTNFDLQIEYAAKAAGVEHRTCFTEDHFRQVSRRHTTDCQALLLKLHGSFADRSSLRATLRQLGDAGYQWQREPARKSVLERIIAIRGLVVVGYSGLDDFDIVPILQSINRPRALFWIQHDSSSAPTIQDCAVTKDAPSPVLALIRSSFARAPVYIARGPSHTFLEMLGRQTGIELGEYHDDHADEPAVSLDTFLDAWLLQCGLGNVLTRRVLSAALFISVSKDDWAKDALQGEVPSNEVHSWDNGHRLNLLGTLAFHGGDYPQARESFTAGLEVFDGLGSIQNCSSILTNLGNVALRLGENEEAETCYREALRLKRVLRDPRGLHVPLLGLAFLAEHRGDRKRRRRLLREALQAAINEGDLRGESMTRSLLAAATLESHSVLDQWESVLRQIPDLRGAALVRGDAGSRAMTDTARRIQRRSAATQRTLIPKALREQWTATEELDERERVQLEQAVTNLAASATLLEQTGDIHQLCGVLTELTTSYFLLQEWQGYERAMGRRISAAKRSGDLKLLAGALADLISQIDEPHFRSACRDHWSDVIRFVARHLRDFDDAHDASAIPPELLEPVADAYYAASIHLMSYDSDLAINWARRAAGLYRRAGLEEKEAHAVARQGRLQCEAGNYKDGIEQYQRAREAFRRLDSPAAAEIDQAIQLASLLAERGADSSADHERDSGP